MTCPAAPQGFQHLLWLRLQEISDEAVWMDRLDTQGRQNCLRKVA